MLEWLTGSYWDNEAAVLLIIQRHWCRQCYTGGMLMVFVWGLCLGSHRDLPAAAEPSPHVALTKCPCADHFGPEPVSAPTSTSSCFVQPSDPLRRAFPPVMEARGADPALPKP